jgi:hypothetical protein
VWFKRKKPLTSGRTSTTPSSTGNSHKRAISAFLARAQ